MRAGLAALLFACLQAHDPKLTFTRIDLSNATALVSLTTPAVSLAALFGNDPEEWKTEKTRSGSQKRILDHLALSNGDFACAPESVKTAWIEDLSSVRYTFRFRSDRPFDRLSVFYDLYLDLPDTAGNFNQVQLNLFGYNARVVFKPERRALRFAVGELLHGWGLDFDGKALPIPEAKR